MKTVPQIQSRSMIFLSSTDDPVVREYRLSARELIEEEFSNIWKPVDMSEFNPSGNLTLTECEEMVLSCSVYIGLIGPIFGTLNPDVDMSYTQYEYSIAKREGREIALFFLPDSILNAEPTELLLAQARYLDRQRDFKVKLKQENTIRSVDSLDEFKNRLRLYLLELTIPDTRSPAPIKSQSEVKFLGEAALGQYDMRPVQTYSLADLNMDLVRSFIQSERSQVFLLDKGLSRAGLLEQLQSLGIFTGDCPTLGAFLAFAPYSILTDKLPSCCLYLVAHEGNTKTTNARYRREETGNLIDLFDYGMKFFSDQLRQVGTAGAANRDDLEIPRLILREVLANALIHRDYEHPEAVSQPTRIEIYSDRVEVISFGKLLPGNSLEVLNKDPEKIVSRKRNPILARIFLHLAIVELGGAGIERIHKVCKEKDLYLPRIEVLTEPDLSVPAFKVSLYRPINFLPDAINTPLAEPPQFRPGRKSKIKVINVMISGTLTDLQEHKQAIQDAIQRLGMYPLWVENLVTDETDLITIAQEMLDEADIYIGLLGHKYGYVPKSNLNPNGLSLTEIEYRRALERGIPILMFVMSDDHPVKRTSVETDPEKLGKLSKWKAEVLSPTNPVAVLFDSASDLRQKVVESLAKTNLRAERRDLTNLHSITARDIPIPPDAYIAHRYSLLETKDVIGRHAELSLLSGWITGKHPQILDARILSLVAVGGMGKSALTWKWFNDIAPVERPDLKGRLWWSFHESDAGWENFILRALAYVTGRDEDDLRQNTKPGEREDTLLGVLDREPYLLALDGLERILIAYARMDAAHLHDDEYDQRTANVVAGAIGLPEDAGESFVGQVDLRKCADPRAGAFLRRLASVKASRILITTRLYPAELQAITGYPLPGCFAAFLKGLTDDDAVNLWREFGVTGTREELLKLFASFENYPLLIRALAGEVARYKRAPGDFDAWRAANPDFNPYQERLLTGRKSYVLGYALTGLTVAEKRVLETIAAFRMPATYDTLVALLVPSIRPPSNTRSVREEASGIGTFFTESALDSVLYSLEGRGLVGWDRAANRYDLHPIVRGIIWSRLGEDDRRSVYRTLKEHFEAVPDRYSDYRQVERFEDLTPAVELYQALIGLGRYDDAYIVFRDRLSNATLYRLSANLQSIEMLESLFPDGLDHLPRLSQSAQQGFTLNALAQGYQFSGEPGRAVALFRRHNDLREREGEQQNLSVGLCNLAEALRLSGSPFDSEVASRRALAIGREREDRFREALSLQLLGTTLAACGRADEAMLSLRRSLVSCHKQNEKQAKGYVQAYRAQAALWHGDPQSASMLADHAWKLAHDARYEADFIRAARLQGVAALAARGDFDHAFDFVEERLHHALGRARAVNLVEEELPALVGLAELARRRGKLDEARTLLDDVWEPAQRGPYPLWHADAFNELASVERAAGNDVAAIEAARQAYTYAWCDGISADGSVCYAYAPGLKVARAHLDALGAKYPVLPPFDESKYEPMPEVEINPKDEYWVDPATVDEV